MSRLAGLFVVLLAFAAAAAEPRHFVVLGSYSTMADAERAKAEAAERLPEPYSLVAADTPRGIFYRVMAGPYLAQEQVARTLDKARAVGYGDAWVLEEASPLSGLYPSDSYLALEGLSTQTDEVEDRLLSGMEGYEAPPEPVTRRTDPPAQSKDGGPILIEEAPPGYELHRLRRSGDS